MKKWVLVVVVMTAVAFTMTQAFADVGPTPPPAPAPAPTVVQAPSTPPASTKQVTSYSSVSTVTVEKTQKEYQVGDKFLRGLANILTSPLEVPINVQNMTEEQGVLVGWTGGMAKGIGMTALRIIVGAYEVITFPIPIPADYKPVIEPEYVWQTPGPKITPQGSAR
ncbi:MAG TPA: exosortase system-associated protein, TIGR04073 family [Candidatus Omnitrophota bacterium]|nr:exosortase system-associated protein, TIGR04073 family [Candidatus Omnitrophota bacterium]